MSEQLYDGRRFRLSSSVRGDFSERENFYMVIDKAGRHIALETVSLPIATGIAAALDKLSVEGRDQSWEELMQTLGDLISARHLFAELVLTESEKLGTMSEALKRTASRLYGNRRDG